MNLRALRDGLKYLLDRPRWQEQDYDRAIEIADRLNAHATRDQIAAHERRLGKIRAKAVANGVGLPAMRDIQMVREVEQARQAGDVKRVDEIWREARRRKWSQSLMIEAFEG